MRARSVMRSLCPPAGLAVFLCLLNLALAAPRAFAQGYLTEGIKQDLVQLAAAIKEKSPLGQRYLRESGLFLVVVIPSMESMLEHLRQAHAAGQIDDKFLRDFEQKVQAAPPQARLEPSFKPVGPGFEPSTTLPRPFGTTTKDGKALNVSERFMNKFQISTAYDLQRLIRNASVLLTNFAGGIERDNFPNHQSRLVQFYRSEASAEFGMGGQSYARDVLFLTAAFMVLDQDFFTDHGAALTAEDHYVAAILIGSTFKLF